MPHISQNFHHVMDSYTKVAAGLYDYTGALKNISYLYKEPSELFWNDLKSMLENLPLDITFSEHSDYVASKQTPYFQIWGLDFSPTVLLASAHTSSYSLIPIMHRHYEYSPLQYSFKFIDAGTANHSTYILPNARINKSNTEYMEIDYTIEIRYNTDFLLIEYRPYADKTIKFTMCCLIKGIDINGKEVVYASGGCNTYGTASPYSSAYNWTTYHKLIWCESPKLNPYTGSYSYPAYDTTVNIDRSSLSSNIIFMDLVNNTYTLHSSKIQLGTDNNIALQKPICCWGRVTFSDDILTDPINLTVDTDYEINGETYYCPGDYVTIATMQGGLNYNRYGMKFLLKI